MNGSTGSADVSTTIAAGAAPAGGAAQAAPANAVQLPWYSDYLKSDGSVNSASYERLPDHLKHLIPTLSNAKTMDDVFIKMSHLNTLAGKKGLAPLPADAPPDVVASRNELMRSINGVPEKPEGYGISRPNDLPEEAWNQKAADAAAAIMHKYNMPPAAAKELVASQISLAKEQIAAQSTYEANFFAEQERTILEELRKSGMPVDKATDLASRTARTFGIDPEADAIFKNAKMFLALTKIGEALGEPKLVTGESQPSGGAANDVARAEDIIHNKANPENAAYWDGSHPMNKQVKAKVNALMAEGVRRSAAQGGSRR